MTAMDLKKMLIHRIAEIDDVTFLEAIKTILDSKTSNNLIKITDEQREDIIASKKDFSIGLFLDQKELDQEINRWVNEQ
jgi:hypothetical protein